MKDLIPLTIGAILGGTVSTFAQSYIDPFNVTDCKEYAKKQVGAGALSDHETLLSRPDYLRHYQYCLQLDAGNNSGETNEGNQ